MSADNQQEKGRTTSLAIVIAPNLTIVRNVRILLHGRLRQSLSVPINVDVVVLHHPGCFPH